MNLARFIKINLVIIATIFAFLGTTQNNAFARYASIIMDARTGKVLHAANPDRRRYPASLTKMMTLYMLFDAIDRRRLSLRQRLAVSRRAAGMAPSKLGLKRGQSIRVEDAVLALITKSANDVAVVVAEAIGGTEIKFSRLMTKKARKLGMRRTRFRNASGLPNRRQVSTARDMAILAQRLIRDFPQFYHYFATEKFRYKRRTYRNHNAMLRTNTDVDGIKTGYIRASGFNLVASAKRHGRRLIGVVFCGRSAKSRDRHMKGLLDRAFRLVPKRRKYYPKTTAEAIRNTPKKARLAPRSPSRYPRLRHHGKVRHWAVQVGAFSRPAAARLAAYGAAGRLLGVADHGRVAIVRNTSSPEPDPVYRAQIIGLSQHEAMKSCRYLRSKRHACVPIPPEPNSNSN